MRLMSSIITQLTLQVSVMWWVCLWGVHSLHQPAPVFDGVLKASSDGRAEAYLIPPFPTNHASNLELLPNHDVMVAWFSGSKGGASGVAIVLSTLHHGAHIFTNASVLSQRWGFSNQNPVLFHCNVTDRVYLFHSQQKANEGEANAEVWALQTTDNTSETWTTPKPLLTKPGSYDRNRVVVSLKQTWLLPIYYSGSQETSSVMEGLHQDLNPSDWQEHPIPGSLYLAQPSIVRLKPGEPELVAFFRDRRAEHIYRSDSADDGVTWSRPTKTTLPNNNGGVQAAVLQSGNMAIVYNPSTTYKNPLVISLSEDGGMTWPYTRTLQWSSNPSDDFSYPSLAQAADGQIHVSHTYLRQTIKYHIIPNEQWIKQPV